MCRRCTEGRGAEAPTAAHFKINNLLEMEWRKRFMIQLVIGPITVG